MGRAWAAGDRAAVDRRLAKRVVLARARACEKSVERHKGASVSMRCKQHISSS